jgi:hypothetical protein
MTVDELIADLEKISTNGGGNMFVGTADEFSPWGALSLNSEDIRVVEVDDEEGPGTVVVLGTL